MSVFSGNIVINLTYFSFRIYKRYHAFLPKRAQMPPHYNDWCTHCGGLATVYGDTSMKHRLCKSIDVECVQRRLEKEEIEAQKVFEAEHRERYLKHRSNMPVGDSEHKLLLDKLYYSEIHGVKLV